MTRLFVRFYISVLAILLIALGIIVFASFYRIDVDFNSFYERAVGSGVSLARQIVAEEGMNERTLDGLRQQSQVPVELVPMERSLNEINDMLASGAQVAVYHEKSLTFFSHATANRDALRFGPVVQSKSGIEADMIAAMAGVLFLIAIAIAILLRPLARQLSLLEQTAISFAEGNLSARVNVDRTDSAKTLAQAINEMAERTEALLRTQRELLQAVSHELRTPLARIGFATDLIRTASSTEERESRLQSLDTAAHELDALVGELLQYVRLETGAIRTDHIRFELSPLVIEQVDKLKELHVAINVAVGQRLANNEFFMVADRAAIARTLANILGNACRFAKSRVIIEANEVNSKLVIDVDDDGKGIPPSERLRVFQPFVRLDESISGVGLGLALVSRIVANHGGKIEVLDSPLGGCRMRTTWPIVYGAGIDDVRSPGTQAPKPRQ